MFCSRSAAESAASACSALTGRSTVSVTVPLTRGSTMKVRPVKSAMARATASISVLVKLSVRRCSWACAAAAIMKAASSAATPRTGPPIRLRMSLSFFLRVDRQEHLVSRAHAEHAQQPIQRALHGGLRGGRAAEADPRTFHCAASLHLQRAGQGLQLQGGYPPRAPHAQTVAAQGHYRRKCRLCIAPIDLQLAGKRGAADLAVGPGELEDAGRAHGIERRSGARQHSGGQARAAFREADALRAKRQRERRAQPRVRHLARDAATCESVDTPLDAPGDERGFAAVAETEQRSALPERAARIDQPQL